MPSKPKGADGTTSDSTPASGWASDATAGQKRKTKREKKNAEAEADADEVGDSDMPASKTGLEGDVGPSPLNTPASRRTRLKTTKKVQLVTSNSDCEEGKERDNQEGDASESE